MLPANAVQAQGLGSVSADQLNTFVQTCDNINELRAFTGISGMLVEVKGYITPGDSGGGFYWWNAASTAADNGTTIIVPTGIIQGAWILQPVNPASLPTLTVSSFYDMPIYLEGMPAADEVYPIFNVVRDCYLPVGLTGSVFTIGVNPTDAITLTLEHNGGGIGTIAFSTGGAPTVTFTTKVDFVPGDQFSITWPSSQDATAANIALTFVFSLGS